MAMDCIRLGRKNYGCIPLQEEKTKKSTTFRLCFASREKRRSSEGMDGLFGAANSWCQKQSTRGTVKTVSQEIKIREMMDREKEQLETGSGGWGEKETGKKFGGGDVEPNGL
ncbi:hypothetical protein PIB30_053152 [Stylosanthes scabra]|uniref:Uncharacterized protein n=1 Tax=Stylosanthes scabra TaxID=79078 RepID=A0ABU6RIR1_9FABA|nr:hypothetical protein [Stylosanthes scabra]